MVQPHRRTRGQDRPKPNTGTAGPLRCLPGLLGIYSGGRALYRHIPPNLVVAPRASHNTLDLSMRYPHHVFLRANGI